MKFAQLFSECQKYSCGWLAKLCPLNDLNKEDHGASEVCDPKSNTMNTPTYPESNMEGAAISGATETRRPLPNRRCPAVPSVEAEPLGRTGATAEVLTRGHRQRVHG